MCPAPAKPVPIYVGGLSKPGLRRAARLGDGWISVVNKESEIRAFVQELRYQRGEWGRSEQPFEIKVVCADVFDVDGFRRLEDAGVTDCITMPWYFYGGELGRLETKTEAMRRFAETVIARVSP